MRARPTSLFTQLLSSASLSLREPRICVKVEVAILVPNCSYGLCGCKVTLNLNRDQDMCESAGGRAGYPNSPYVSVDVKHATLEWGR